MDVQFVDTESKRKELQDIRASVIQEIRETCGRCKKLTTIEREKYQLPARKRTGKPRSR